MKHHINNQVLKDLKKELFDIKNDRHKRSREPIDIEFKVDGEVDTEVSKRCILINYGCVQTDKDGHVISSDDNSYNFHYRRLAQKDKYEYYQLTIDSKKNPQVKIYVINRDLTLIKEYNKIGISWTSVKGMKKELTFTKVETEDE